MMKKVGAVLLALAPMGCATMHPYPEAARVRFEASCPSSSPVCTCTWDKLTHTMTYEEYEAAMTRFRESGVMDARVTSTRAQCLEHQAP